MNTAGIAPSHEGILRLQVGGTLIPGRDIYIARPEDALLFDLLRESEYVNILSSRQVGKSSLMLRTAVRLRKELGHQFAVIDLTSLGTPEGPGAYFRGLTRDIVRQLKIQADELLFQDEQGDSGTYTQQFIRFFRETVAGAIDGPVTLFFDEIDSTLKLPYTDDLFTALRSMYNERGLVPEYRRLSFCLVGVATPDELIKDRRTTPYNVGKTIWLGDFDPARDDLAPLVQTLSDDPTQGRRLLNRVLNWTGGHPFLTCRLCQDLRGEEVESPEAVDRYVIGRYATLDRLGEDVHIQQILRFVRERLSDGLASFELYERILKGKPERDQPSLAHAELKLSGLVKRDGEGWLVPRNRIYRRLFDRRWVDQTRPKQQLKRFYALALASALLAAVTVYALTVTWPAWMERQPIHPEMVNIPAGSFCMGSRLPETPALADCPDLPEDDEANKDETPARRVAVPAFRLGKHEVTAGEYRRFVKAMQARGRDISWADDARTVDALPPTERTQKDRLPAVNLSHDDAVAYAEWLSRETGERYRLPTEAEWEYAARAGTLTRRWWGDDPKREDGCTHANVLDRKALDVLKAAGIPITWESFACDTDGYVWSAPVGHFGAQGANGFGLQDMLGNVWEWVADCYHDSYAGAPPGPAAWTDGMECASGRRVIRGGSWDSGPAYLRSASRGRITPDFRINLLGFRLAQDLK
jgi:formylglycine-generating enzyme required for sulfatase activity